MIRSLIFRRRFSSLKEVQSCQDYLDYCRVKNSSLKGTVFRGTLYELTVKHVLESSLNFHSLVRVGGAGDNGLDLFGRWDLSRFRVDIDSENVPKVSPASLLSMCKPHSTLRHTLDLSKDVVVLVQCKNHRSRVKASVVRELAGIREFHINMRSKADKRKTFVMLASPLPVTKQALAQMDTSDVPMLHAQISPLSLLNSTNANVYDLRMWQGGTLGSIYLNFAARTVLHGLSVERKFGEVIR